MINKLFRLLEDRFPYKRSVYEEITPWLRSLRIERELETRSRYALKGASK